METNRFTYDVGILVNFTDDELELLRRCCVAHYDGTVSDSAKQGGFLYGWLNMRSFARSVRNSSTEDIACSFRQLDTCAKALEQPKGWREEDGGKSRQNLRAAIMEVLGSLAERTRLLSTTDIVPAENGR